MECPACAFYIGLAPTCDVTDVEIRGRRYERIRYTTYDGKREHTCPDCAISAPNFHRAGCELELACEGKLAGYEREYVFTRAQRSDAPGLESLPKVRRVAWLSQTTKDYRRVSGSRLIV